MKPLISPWLITVALALFGGVAHADKADRDKPMNIEADALRYDDVQQTSVFTGRVVLTKGTILIRGARVDVRQDPAGNQFGLVTAEPGKLAFFRQKREGLDEYIEGEGELIEYDSQVDTVKFIRKAQLRRYRGATLGDEFTGGVIVYNNTTEVFTIDGTAATPSAGSAGGVGKTSGRVRAMLTPQPAQTGPATTPAPGAATPAPALRSTPNLNKAVQ